MNTSIYLFAGLTQVSEHHICDRQFGLKGNSDIFKPGLSVFIGYLVLQSKIVLFECMLGLLK